MIWKFSYQLAVMKKKIIVSDIQEIFFINHVAMVRMKRLPQIILI